MSRLLAEMHVLAIHDTHDHIENQSKYKCLKHWEKENAVSILVKSALMSFKDKFLHRNGLDGEGLTIVHINFQDSKVSLYEHTVIYMWYDLFGILGGLCSITFGGSIIFIFEVLYLSSGRFGLWFIRRRKQAESRIATTAQVQPIEDRPPATLLWHELKITHAPTPNWNRRPVNIFRRRQDNVTIN